MSDDIECVFVCVNVHTLSIKIIHQRNPLAISLSFLHQSKHQELSKFFVLG